MDTAEFSVVVEEIARPEDMDFVLKSLQAFNRAQAGDNGYRPLFVAVRNGDGNLLGGLLGDTNRGWLHVDILWVAESYRGQGCGGRLLALAEEEARRRGCVGAYLETFSFQAPEFYRKLGYAQFGELGEFRPGGTQYCFYKRFDGDPIRPLGHLP